MNTKTLSVMLLLGLLASCAHGQKSQNLETKVRAQEQKNLSDVAKDFERLIDQHTKISLKDKEELQGHFSTFIKANTELKEKESQILGMKLQHFFGGDQLNTSQYQSLEKMLNEVYVQKSQNTFKFLSEISAVLKNKSIDQDFRRELKWFFREMR